MKRYQTETQLFFHSGKQTSVQEVSGNHSHYFSIEQQQQIRPRRNQPGGDSAQPRLTRTQTTPMSEPTPGLFVLRFNWTRSQSQSRHSCATLAALWNSSELAEKHIHCVLVAVFITQGFLTLTNLVQV